MAPLRQRLLADGFNPASVSSLAVGELLSAQVQSELRSSDLVVALLDPPKNPSQTFYEIGLAEGMGKPVILVVSPTTRLPVDLTGHIVVRPGSDLLEAVSYALRQWREAEVRRLKPERQAEHAPERVIGPVADEYLAGISPGRAAAMDGLRLEMLVEEALKATAEVVVEAPESEQWVDFGVWSDSLNRSVGSPLLVEVKLNVRSAAAARQLGTQLNRRLESSTARYLLLVYGTATSAAARVAMREFSPRILTVAADELFERLRAHPLSELVEDLQRNNASRVGDAAD